MIETFPKNHSQKPFHLVICPSKVGNYRLGNFEHRVGVGERVGILEMIAGLAFFISYSDM